MIRLITVCLFAFVSTQAAFAAEPIDIQDTSFREANGHRVQQLSVVVGAPLSKAWAAFATDSGFTSWAVPIAHITLANDGMMETSYRISSKIGDPDNIKNRIVAYIPEKLLVIRNEHVPKHAPFDPVLIATLRTVITFDAVSADHTRVTETQVGYGESPGYDAMYDHFRDGNAEELRALALSFVSGPVNWKAQAAAMEASVRKPPSK